MKNVLSNTRTTGRSIGRFLKSVPAKVSAGVSTLGVSMVALAGGGGGSPGAAISGALEGGDADMNLVFGAIAALLGLLLLWSLLRRAAKG